jgi:hypothetical protein
MGESYSFFHFMREIFFAICANSSGKLLILREGVFTLCANLQSVGICDWKHKLAALATRCFQ